jgi:hypothetical protein
LARRGAGGILAGDREGRDGRERQRRIAFDGSGNHLLLTTWPDGVVYHHHNRAFTRLPDLSGVDAIDW